MPRAKTKEENEEIARLYKAGLSIKQIAQNLRYSTHTVTKGLDACGIFSDERQKRKIKCGKNNAKWKGGRIVDSNGYIKITIEKSHPFFCMADSCHRVFEHRLIMAEKIGRPLFPFENVHHKNGVRNDNRIENLELWNIKQPSGKKPDDLVKYAIDILNLYQPEALSGLI